MWLFATIAVVCVSLLVAIVFFADEIVSYLNAKTEQIRALTEEIRERKRHAKDGKA